MSSPNQIASLLDKPEQANCIVQALNAINYKLQSQWPARSNQKISRTLAEDIVDSILKYQVISYDKVYGHPEGFVQFSTRPDGLVPNSILAEMIESDMGSTIIINQKYIAAVDRDPVVVKNDTEILRGVLNFNAGFLDTVLYERNRVATTQEVHKKEITQSSFAKVFAKAVAVIPFLGHAGAEGGLEVKTSKTNSKVQNIQEDTQAFLMREDRQLLRFSGTAYFLEDIINSNAGDDQGSIRIIDAIKVANKLYFALNECGDDKEKMIDVLSETTTIQDFTDAIICRDKLKDIINGFCKHGIDALADTIASNGKQDVKALQFWNSMLTFANSGRKLSTMETSYMQYNFKTDPMIGSLAYMAEVYGAVSESVEQCVKLKRKLPRILSSTFDVSEPQLLYNTELLSIPMVDNAVFLENPYVPDGTDTRGNLVGKTLSLTQMVSLFPTIAKESPKLSTSEDISNFLTRVQFTLNHINGKTDLKFCVHYDVSNPEDPVTKAYFKNETGQHYPVLESGYPDVLVYGETDVPRVYTANATDFLKQRIPARITENTQDKSATICCY
jgi:hypothetical protein